MVEVATLEMRKNASLKAVSLNHAWQPSSMHFIHYVGVCYCSILHISLFVQHSFTKGYPKMQLTKTIPTLALVAIGASALQQPQRQVLISFPQDTPQSELDDYKSAIDLAVRYPF